MRWGHYVGGHYRSLCEIVGTCGKEGRVYIYSGLWSCSTFTYTKQLVQSDATRKFTRRPAKSARIRNRTWSKKRNKIYLGPIPFQSLPSAVVCRRFFILILILLHSRWLSGCGNSGAWESPECGAELHWGTAESDFRDHGEYCRVGAGLGFNLCVAPPS